MISREGGYMMRAIIVATKRGIKKSNAQPTK